MNNIARVESSIQTIERLVVARASLLGGQSLSDAALVALATEAMRDLRLVAESLRSLEQSKDRNDDAQASPDFTQAASSAIEGVAEAFFN